MSMMWTPSWPRSGRPPAAGSRNMGQSPQNAPGVVKRSGSLVGMVVPAIGCPAGYTGAGVAEFQERMIRLFQMSTSPWLPTVFVPAAHCSQLTISFGRDGYVTSTSRNPPYVPWTTVSLWNARSELKTPSLESGELLSSGMTRAEYPSAVKLSVTAQLLTTSTAGGVAPSGEAISPTASATSASASLTFTTNTSTCFAGVETETRRRPCPVPLPAPAPWP